MPRHQARAGSLTPAVGHVITVSRRYGAGLFHCSSVPALPRTKNDLEQCFGAYRDHERRTTGRKGASPALVLRGSGQLVAYAATRLRPCTGEALAPDQTQTWQALRQRFETRRPQRTHRPRFRRDPASYLAKLEADFLQLILPP